MDPQQQQQQRPLSARSAALPLADRVTLYCRQTSAANNAAVMRNTLKPSAEEMLEFLQRDANAEAVYSNATLLRVLLTDSDYDSVSREVLSLSDAIEWHSQHANAQTQPQSPSASNVIEMMLQSAHVFSPDQVSAAKQLVVERGLESFIRSAQEPEERSSGDESDRREEEYDNSGCSYGHCGDEQEIAAFLDKSESQGDEKAESDVEMAVVSEGSGHTSHEAPCPSTPPRLMEEHQQRIGDLDQGQAPIVGALPEEYNTSVVVVTQDQQQTLEDLPVLVMAVSDETHAADCPIKSEAFAADAEEDPNSFSQEPQEELPATLTQSSPVCDAGEDGTEEVRAVEDSDDREQAELPGERAEGMESLMLVPGGVPAADTDGEPEVADREPQEEVAVVSEYDVPVTVEIQIAPQVTIGQSPEITETTIATGSSTEGSFAAPLTHSASTVERIVRTLDKQLQGSESEEQDAWIERAINHDAELLQRRYSGIAEEVEKATDLFITPEIQHSTDKTQVDKPPMPVVEQSSPSSANASTLDEPVDSEPAPETAASPALVVATLAESVEEVPAPSFRVGEAVEARYRGWNRYFQGEIAAVVDGVVGVYEVRYADGDYEANVPADFIRWLTSEEPIEPTSQSQISVEAPVESSTRYAIGDHVEALYRGRTRWFPGRVIGVRSAVNGVYSTTAYDIEYEDGETETGVVDHHVRPCAASATTSRPSSTEATVALIESATLLIQSAVVDENREEEEAKTIEKTPAIDEPHQQEDERTERPLRIGDRVCVHQPSSPPLVAWIVGVRESEAGDVVDVLYDAVGGGPRAGAKESGVVSSRIQRLDTKLSADPLARGSASDHDTNENAASGNQEQEERETEATDVTPVLPFHEDPEADDCDDENGKPRQQTPVFVPPVVLEAARLLAQADEEGEENESQAFNLLSERSEDEAMDSDEDSILQSTALLFNPTTPRQSVSVPIAKEAVAVEKSAPVSRTKLTTKRKKPLRQKPQTPHQPQESVLSEATLRYLSPQPRKPVPVARPRTGRSQAAATTPRVGTTASTTPRVGTASTTKAGRPKPTQATVDVSWKELEEWKNVDLILNRKRRIVTNGHVEGSDVPWGEEFAAIQSLKRFAHQYPDVLQQHIEHQLQEVVDSSAATSVARPMTTTATAAARDALLLIKDLAFLLRHRLAPFLDTILPVVLPAVFHSQKRFLCDTAYQVLEALVAHCSSRRLVVALLKQALRSPRDDTRLVNLTCLYIEKCLTSLSFAAVQELLTRSTVVVLEAIAELLSCKSAACQSSLQKSLLLIQQAVGEDTMECLLEEHLRGNSLAIVRKHLAVAMSATTYGANKSPQTSPKKLQATPAKQAAVAAANAGGSMSILQRMLLQRQNRVVPAPE